MTSRIPVVQIITHLPPGGAQRVALTLAQGLDPTRFDAHLIAGPRGDWTALAQKRLGAAFHPAHHLQRELSPYHDTRVIVELTAILRRIASRHPRGFAIVNTHAPKAGVAGRLAARLLGLAPVHTLHGLPFYAQQSENRRRAYRAFERLGYLSGGETVSVTRRNLRAVLDAGWVAPRHARVIPPCVDSDRLAPRRGKRRLLPRYGIPESARVIGVVASLKPPKDLLGFVRAAATVMNERPDVHVVIAGDGEQRPAIEQAIDNAGLTERVTLAGWVDPIEELYPEFDVFVLPTFSEGLPLTLVEARACGVPVIASAVGGIPELIRDGVNGLLVPPGEPVALSAALRRLLDDSDLRSRLIAEGLTGLERYSSQAMLRAYQDLYQVIAARAGALDC